MIVEAYRGRDAPPTSIGADRAELLIRVIPKSASIRDSDNVKITIMRRNNCVSTMNGGIFDIFNTEGDLYDIQTEQSNT